MFKNFLLKKMLASQLKGVPQAEQDRLFNLIEKNPDFFKNLAEKIHQKMQSGKSQMDATMEVMRENETLLKEIAVK
ncbi:MAG: hypothetical protein PHF79_01655 [Candidatus Pacebacteria bacterium]|nr:hypothetical protein [Candidatus Paceibacterota bacterium]